MWQTKPPKKQEYILLPLSRFPVRRWHNPREKVGKRFSLKTFLPLARLNSVSFAKSLIDRNLGYRAFKRFFDFVFALLVIVVGFIPGALLSIAIAIDTKGNPIYSQERIGKHGKTFRIYKFRSMMKDSDDVEKYFTPEQLETWKRERKVDNDPRVTKLGRVLRSSSLDEIPQLVNVFLGQISLIGPRVITRDELLQHFSDYEKAELLSVTPGIAWDIIAPKRGAGEKSFWECEFLPAYEGIREDWVMAA